MNITRDVRTCTANLNCDREPTGLLLGVNGGTKARYVNRDSRKCSEIRGTASKLSCRRDSTFPVENQGKLYRISSENATEARTPDEHGLQNENIKAVGTSQTVSTSDYVAAEAKRSNGLKVRSGKSGLAQPRQLTQNSRHSAKAANDNGNPMRPVKKSGDKLPPTSGQDLGVKAKIVPLKYSSKPSSSAWKVKEKKETSKEPSNLSPNMSSSDQVHRGQPTQKGKCSAGAVKKSRNQIQAVKKSGKKITPTPEQEKEKKEPSEGPSHFPTKLSLSDRAHRDQPVQKRKCSAQAVKKSGNQLPAIPKQVWQVKGKIASSQDSGKTSSKVFQVKKKTSSTLSSKTSSSHAKTRSFSPEHSTKWDGFVKLGHNCFLCENDLAHSPLPTDEELESDKLPDVAVLPCGHAFHAMCLQQAIPEDQLRDPSCFVCDSLQ
ncbi:PREDICTED: uncharacterized protein LOC105116537 [Populus euphratica]|uniref:Uncharacterized protein LOC105116537 n=1 Tax=Populus euphratica TaxID=75702 RepID=A0AAJ6XBA7_POPEU|nr:PREDICTED: uncharacterized protein LOC105116537 [Populus euphratica]